MPIYPYSAKPPRILLSELRIEWLSLQVAKDYHYIGIWTGKGSKKGTHICIKTIWRRLLVFERSAKDLARRHHQVGGLDWEEKKSDPRVLKQAFKTDLSLFSEPSLEMSAVLARMTCWELEMGLKSNFWKNDTLIFLWRPRVPSFLNGRTILFKKKSESLQTEGRHFRSMICKLSDV